MKPANITTRLYTYKGKTEKRWVVGWTDPEGKRCEKSFHNRRHAEDEKAKINRNIDQGIHEVGSSKITFGKLWKAWVAHCEERRELDDHAGNTLTNYYWAADHILPEFEQRQARQITPDDMDKFVFKMLKTPSRNSGKPLARHSVKNFVDYMIQAFEYGIRKKKWLVSNPARGTKVPGEKPDIYIPSFEDVELLIQILHEPQPPWCQTITWENQKIAFALRAFAGMRGGEIAALRWDTINLSGTTLKIPKEAGSHSMVDGLKKPKSKAGERTIPISRYLYDALLVHGHATGMTGYVIKPQSVSRQSESREKRSSRLRRAAVPDDVNHLSSQAISDMHHDLMVRANLTDGVQPNGKPKVKFRGHDLRHWWVSARLAIGHNLVAVSKQAGHYDPSFTIKTYADVIEGAEDGTKESVPPIWHERFARAVPGQPTMIEGVASESGPIIEGEATRLIETVIPEKAYPWVPEALRLLEGGWRVSDVTRHLGQCRTNINRAFHALGLPNPDQIRRKVQERKFEELRVAGSTDKEIARKLNCSEGTVYHWRRTKEEGVPNTRAEFRRLGPGQTKKKLTDEQVHEVFDRLEAGESCAAIGKRFSVSHGLISNIKAGRNYRWVMEKRGKNEGTQDLDKLLEYNEKLAPAQVAETEKMRESQLKLL